jgi:predicted glycoside hydrolase/deacetylase ChbG (UPF0249 family)
LEDAAAVEKYLIVNGDDFGASVGVNGGVLECHTRGVLTSTSLMVTGRAVQDAVAISRDHPALGVGLHWDVWGEDEREFDLSDLEAVRDEFRRQLDEFARLMGRMPTHVDSHRHAHRDAVVMAVFRELVEPLGVPLRGCGRVAYVGGFYAQWEWQVTKLEHVSVPFLQKLLREEVAEGWTEIACHPGFITPDFHSEYRHEREEEVRTLTDPRIRLTIQELGISLANFADYQAAPRSEEVTPSNCGSAVGAA